MKRAWIALAVLSVSWLLGMEYFQEARPWWWAASIVLGTLLLAGMRLPAMGRLEAAICLTALVPAMIVAPGIYRAVPMLLAAGAAISACRFPLRRLERLGGAATAAGVVLLAQALAMHGYEAFTARRHDVPLPIARAMAGVARLIGAEASFNAGPYGANIELFTMRRVHSIGATWELLVGPATFCFLAGGLALLLLYGTGSRWKQAGVLTAIVLAWLPLRVGLLLGIYLHRALLSDYDAALDLMSQFFNPWVHLAMLAGPVILACVLISNRPVPEDEAAAAQPAWSPRNLVAPVAAAIGAVLVVFGLFWCPSGAEKKGRILFDEHCSKWEPTDRAYDTHWYGSESGYNYYCIYDYCSHFFPTQRLVEPIRSGTLRPDDLLIVKVPTSAYAQTEIEEIERFVRGGGSVLFIGEHTDVFGTGTHINQITRRFGFTFRYDCAFGIRSVFEQLYEPPLLAHPIVQRMPPLDFEISATIDVGASPGRAAIRGTGLKNAFADYHASNFYPQIDDFPNSRYGSFVQLWAREFGAGRVVGFADSTQYSNFSAFEPGKPEMLMGMIQWLRRSNSPAPGGLFALLGAVLLLGALVLVMRSTRRWFVVIAAALLGWGIAVPAVRAAHRAGLPEPAPIKPITKVAIDRTVSDATLSKGGFIGGKPDGFGIFERWILRLGWFPFRLSGDAVFDSKLIVFFHPHRDVDRAFREKLLKYVEDGGHILIIDSPENEKSTANHLLWPFKISLKKSTPLGAGTVVAVRGLPLPEIPVPSALPIEGGMAIGQMNVPGAGPVAVAAGKAVGRGSVTVIGFGARFTDTNMGVTGDMEPGPQMRAVYEYEYELLRRIMKVKAATRPATQPAQTQPTP